MISVQSKKRMDNIMTSLFLCGAGFAVVLLVAFVGFVIVEGFSGMTPEMLSFTGSGMGNMFFNTLYLVFLALIASTITGIPAGIYLAEYAKKGRITHWVRMAVETLASLPSIVVGLFGYLVFIVMTGSQWNLFAGSLAVSILTLPLVTSVTEESSGQPRPGRIPLADNLARTAAGLFSPHHDWSYHGRRPRIRRSRRPDVYCRYVDGH